MEDPLWIHQGLRMNGWVTNLTCLCIKWDDKRQVYVRVQGKPVWACSGGPRLSKRLGTHQATIPEHVWFRTIAKRDRAPYQSPAKPRGVSLRTQRPFMCVWHLFWSMLPMRLSLDSVDTTDCGEAIERRQEHLHRETKSHSGCLRASAKTSLSGFPAQASLYPSPPGVTHIWSGCLKTQVPWDPWELPGPK